MFRIWLLFFCVLANEVHAFRSDGFMIVRAFSHAHKRRGTFGEEGGEDRKKEQKAAHSLRIGYVLMVAQNSRTPTVSRKLVRMMEREKVLSQRSGS